MISSMADDSPPPSLTSESQPDGFRTASVRPECHPLYPSPSSSESMLASKAFLPFPTLPLPTRPGSHPRLPLSWNVRPIPSWHPAPQAAGLAHRVTGPGCMQQWQGTCSSSWQKALLPSPLGRDRNGGHPGTQKKGKQKEANQKQRRAIRAAGGGQRLPRAGQWGSPCECIRPGDWEWRGKAKGSDEGMEGQSGGRRKSSHAAWDKSFVALSDSQSINWRLLEPGTQGSVEERRAREEIRRTGMASCPGLHFAVIICTNSS